MHTLGTLYGDATDASLPVYTKDMTYHIVFRSYKEVGDRKVYGGIQKLDVTIPGYFKPEFTIESPVDGEEEIAGIMTYYYELPISNYSNYLDYKGNLTARFEAFVLADDDVEAVQDSRAEGVGLSYHLDDYCNIMIDGEKYCYVNADNSGKEGSLIINLPKDKEYTILMRACRATGDTELCSGYTSLKAIHRIDFMKYPIDMHKDSYYVTDGEAVLAGRWGMSPVEGYEFDDVYIARDCTTQEKINLGLKEADTALCPTDTKLDMDMPVHENLKWVEKWNPVTQ